MNKALSGAAILLFFNLLGEAISYAVFPILPGSIVGMLLLFFSLQLKIVKEEWIESLISVILKNLSLLFLAPSVGIVAIYDAIKGDIGAIAVTVFLSTILVIISVSVSLNILLKKWKN